MKGINIFNEIEVCKGNYIIQSIDYNFTEKYVWRLIKGLDFGIELNIYYNEES